MIFLIKRTRYFTFLLVILTLMISACSKDTGDTVTIPLISTSMVTNITSTTASCGGTVTSDGGAAITARGICWSTAVDPTLTDFKSSDGSLGTGSYNCNIFGLTGNTTYYVRAYASNSSGTGYGDMKSFTSSEVSYTSITKPAEVIDTASAILHGSVNANNLSVIVTFEYGFTTGYGNTISALQSPVTGNGETIVNADIAGLLAGTTYHFRVKSQNSLGGIEYGEDLTFTTLGELPQTITVDATNVKSVSATLNGTVNANYLMTIVEFEYGTTASYGLTATPSQNPVAGNITTNVSSDISGLTLHTTYHYRIKAENSYGITYSDDLTFTTHYVVGESYFGGVIFYIDNSGEHGMVCAAEDQSTGEIWYNGSYMITNANGTSIGTGAANTFAIVAVQGTGVYAAKLCDDLVLNGYSDWFLPSKDELHLMYDYLNHGSYGYAEYWSSSEGDLYTAWKLGVQTGGLDSNYYNKFGSHPIRAARAF